jgi:hypothetical protein
MAHDVAHPLTEAATWPDDIKSDQWLAFNTWHFKDIPYIAEGFTPATTEIDPENSAWAINQAIKTLHSNQHRFLSGVLGKSIMLRFLIHIIGDVHQPLHSTTYYSEKFPVGDRGGNSFHVSYAPNAEVKNLHALWDSCLDQYGSIYAPLTDENWGKIGSFADSIMSAFPQSSLDLKLGKIGSADIDNWINDSFGLAKTNVYAGITPDGTVSDDYIKTNRVVINKQLALAGYRLAATIKKFVTSDTLEAVEESFLA